MEEKEEFTMIHGLKFKLKDPHSETLKKVVHDWEHHSDHNKLHDLLHEARNASGNKQHFKDEGVTAVHHSDGYYTLEKTEHH
ncbi:MAG: hypothetical protein UV76_C0002G0134 [Candidatus Nomurabacteria bacterium GW2011_GWA2_43_15]|uniref:Uncharacterized protein n=1 Tax=Candidatus Nomurabacteria bacterium GW2011_GWA2_43_15 TaxID=1618738 RepID=A0A0G1DTK5_9BACT|nr:MAG: hypothetical protein UV76_C0002G0134 [Candidatus Nomurabacteria bacterium GW2011_GWA2_43_15]